jgi:hypothetical protein
MSGTASATSPPPEFARQLIDLRHRGVPWEECAKQLGRTASALNLAARRLRDQGKWRLANGRPAKGAPRAGVKGRPRNATPSAAISPRFAPDVADALRTIAASAGVRVGLVIAEAMQRGLDRHAKRRVSRAPLGLEPGERFDLVAGNRTTTLAVNVPQAIYEPFAALYGAEGYVATAITDAVHRLLGDLNYTLIDPEAP